MRKNIEGAPMAGLYTIWCDGDYVENSKTKKEWLSGVRWWAKECKKRGGGSVIVAYPPKEVKP